MHFSNERFGFQSTTHLIDVLALKLRDELLEALVISLNTDGAEDLLDISSGRGGVPADLEEEVGSNVTHLHAHPRSAPVPQIRARAARTLFV